MVDLELMEGAGGIFWILLIWWSIHISIADPEGSITNSVTLDLLLQQHSKDTTGDLGFKTLIVLQIDEALRRLMKTQLSLLSLQI